jgi:hypothetical protein
MSSELNLFCFAVFPMTISVTCSSGHTINASEKYAGKIVKCPKCNASVKIPEVAENALSDEEVFDLTAAVDPFSDFQVDNGSSDPFSQFPAESPSNFAAPSYAPSSYPAASYSQSTYPVAGGAAYPAATPNSVAAGPANTGPRGPAANNGNKPASDSAAKGMPAILIGVVFGGGTFVIVLGVLGSVLYLVRNSIPRFGSTNQVAATSMWGFDSADEFELARAEFMSENFPDGKEPTDGNKAEFDRMMKAFQELSSPSSPVYMGYDSSIRARMRKYLQAQGYSEGKAALVALSLNATVRMMAKELDLPVDSKGNYPIPQLTEGLRKLVLDKPVDELELRERFEPLRPLLKAHREKKLSEEELDLVFYAKLAVIRI